MAKPVVKTTNKTKIEKQNIVEEKEKIEEKQEFVSENTKENIVDNKTQINKDEDLIKELKQSNEQKDKEIAELSKNMLNMQQQLNMIMQQMMNNSRSAEKSTEYEEVIVGSRALYDTVLATSDDKLVIKFSCDEEKAIDVEDLRLLFKDVRSNKLLFEEDTLYFVDPSNYERFKIKRKVDLSPENITRILLLPTHDMIDEINKMTNSLVDFRITNSLQFQIVKLLISKKRPLKEWSYESREVLERYIGKKFNDLMAAVGALEQLGRQTYDNL